MRQDLNYSEFIERYLQGEMGPDERAWFEKEIEGNVKLYEEVSLRKKVNLVLSDSELIELKSQLEQIHDEISIVTEKGKATIRKIYRRVYYIAGIIVLLIAGVGSYLYTRNYSNEKLLREFYQPASATINYRSAGSENDQLSQAMEFYKQKEYSKAIQLFEQILDKDSTKIGVNLYSGISNMEIKQYKKANDKFEKIIRNQPNPFVESAKWYLGMCYIMTNNRDKAAEQFEELANAGGYYQAHATKLLRHLE